MNCPLERNMRSYVIITYRKLYPRGGGARSSSQLCPRTGLLGGGVEQLKGCGRGVKGTRITPTAYKNTFMNVAP